MAQESLECSICQEENLKEIGELDVCDHCYCLRCILEWSKLSNTCPLCKQRFWTVTHKRIDQSIPSTEACRYAGKVLRQYAIAEKNQVVRPEDAVFEDPMDTLVCMECGEGHDDELILICDSCNQGCHTYCAHPPLDEVPDGNWYCSACAPTLADFATAQPEPRRRRTSRTSHARRPQTRQTARDQQPESSRARAQRHARYAEQREREVFAALADSEEDSDSDLEAESEAEEEVWQSSDSDVLIAELADRIASRIGQPARPQRRQRQQPQRSRPATRRRQQAPAPAAPPVRRLRSLSSRRARTASDSWRRRALAHNLASSPRPSTRAVTEDPHLAALPSRSHRQVEQYRSNWDQIRRNEDLFQPEEEVHLLDSSDSDEEDAMENISLADRLKLRAATEVLERQRQSRLAAGGQEDADIRKRRLLNGFGRPIARDQGRSLDITRDSLPPAPLPASSALPSSSKKQKIQDSSILAATLDSLLPIKRQRVVDTPSTAGGTAHKTSEQKAQSLRPPQGPLLQFSPLEERGVIPANRGGQGGAILANLQQAPGSVTGELRTGGEAGRLKPSSLTLQQWDRQPVRSTPLQENWPATPATTVFPPLPDSLPRQPWSNFLPPRMPEAAEKPLQSDSAAVGAGGHKEASGVGDDKTRSESRMEVIEDFEERKNFKAKAFHYVREVLTPWYDKGKMTKEEFKMSSQMAVRGIYRSGLPVSESVQKWQEMARSEIYKAMKQLRVGKYAKTPGTIS